MLPTPRRFEVTMLFPRSSRRRTRISALPLLFLTVLGLLIGGLGAPAYAAAGSISGTVTRAGALETTPLPGVLVSLLTTDGAPVMTGDPATAVTARTAENGSYALATPDTGSSAAYKLKFSDQEGEIRTEFYDDAQTAGAASAVTVGNGASVTGINAAVASTNGSEIGGLVKTNGGAPIDGATITLLRRNPADAVTGEVTYSEVVSQTTGDGLPAGTWKLDQTFGKYVVRLSAPAYGTFYFQGNNSLTANRDSAPEIEVKEGVAVPLNATLTAQTTTTISGTVTSGGTPVQGVEISVEYAQLNAQGQTTWTEVQSSRAKTAANGSYTATVPPAQDGREYVVGFKAPGFRTEYFDDSSTRNGASVVHQTPKIGAPVAGISADLDRATQVAGKVTDQAGAGLSGVAVTAVVYTAGAHGAHGTWGPLRSGGDGFTTTTRVDGNYVLDVPADTKFRLEFVAPDQRPTRYFPSASFVDEAATISVPASTALTGRNMTLPTVSTIRGTLTEPTGGDYSGSGTVSAWKEVTWTELGELGGVSHTSWFQVPGSSATVSNGAFTVRVPQGSYRLKFVDSATAEEGFLPGLVGLDQAPDVSVGVQQDLAGQTYQLPSVQTVRGLVSDIAGTPVVGAFVGAEYTYVGDIRDGVGQPSDPIGPNASPARRSASTQAGGTYTLQLRSRTYRVFAKTGPTAIERSYFGDLQEDGTRIARDVVVAASDVSGIDVTLDGGVLQNTRIPWISGLNDRGATLTANEGAWSPQAGLGFTYAWESRLAPTTSAPNPEWLPLTRENNRGDGLGNPSANGRTVAIPSASTSCTVFGMSCPANAQYRVTVTATRDGVSVTAPTSLATQLTDDTTPADELRAAPRIVGRAVVGETLTTDSGVWAQQSSYTYQWFRGLVPIDGATSSTYQPVPADIGSTLMVEVRPTNAPSNPPAASAPTARVGNGTLSNTKAPSISGTAKVGETLTASPGTWAPTPSSFTYAWLANGQPIAGATSSTYKPVEADVAKVITVQVTAQLAGYTSASKQSSGTSPVSLDGTDPTKLVNKNEPTVTGTAQVGRTLTADNGDWTNAPTFTYQWLADGTDITGATSRTYLLTAGEEGKVVSVEVTARRDGFEPVTIESDSTNPVAKGVFTNSEKPSVTGTVRPGSTVAALPGSWSPSTGVSYDYQWLLDGAPISGATASTYLVEEDDVDKLLGIRVTATAPGYADSSATADPVLVTPDGDTSMDQAVASAISGDPVVGETLRLAVGSTSPAYSTVAIQWLRDGTPIAGRTGTSYPVERADLGATLSARMTYKRPGYTDLVETVTTVPVTEPVEPVKPTLKTSKKVKGKKLVVKVRVLADSQDPVTGQVELTEGKKLYALK
ncbi:MAG: hypothetical protein VX494_04745, partial [Actinomycetota bacterium]|nr:hypothetical protein [Actinomycetota bacterium]